MTLGLTDSISPPSVDFQGLKQKEAVQSGSVSWASRLVEYLYCYYRYRFGMCLLLGLSCIFAEELLYNLRSIVL